MANGEAQLIGTRRYSFLRRKGRGEGPSTAHRRGATVQRRYTPTRAHAQGGGHKGEFWIMENEKIIDPVEERIRELTSALRSAKTPAHIRKLLKGTIRNIAWLEMKLDEVRDSIPEGEILREYDNGGGQKGVQESPLLKAYEKLFREYTTGMSEIMEALPKDSREPIMKRAKKKEPENVLQLLSEKQRNKA